MSTAKPCAKQPRHTPGYDGSGTERFPRGTGRHLGDPERLAVITRLGLHGQLGDPHLDAVVATAAAACHAPMAAINIVIPDHQMYAAEVGVDVGSTNVSDGVSFCAEVVLTGRPLAVADASADPVYRTHPLVVANVIGAYAGEPLVHEGQVIGALSVFDSSAREFTTGELAVLHAQAKLAMAAVRLRALDTRDPLTGLGNRRLLLERASQALSNRSSGQIVGLLVLDVVGTGRVNAELGTPAGDLVLRAVSDRLQGACGSSDSVTRLGGDEFAVLLDKVASREDARARAASICTAVRGHLRVQEVDVELQVRCGLTTSYTDNADELLAAAERAAGAEPPPPEHVRVAASEPSDVVELAGAIDDNQLVLHYHPILELGTGQVAGVEALVRWQHPERGLLQPSDFITLAEDSGLIVQLGDWVLRAAATQAATWAAAGCPLDVAINLSPVQMAASGFADDCLALLAQVQAPLERIVLEVTESALLDQPEAARALRQLRSAGVRLALDDFGTGYSSFAYLRRFPIDTIKIDRSFVSGLGRHPDDDAIVASVVGLARNTGKTVVAEGVTTPAQLAHLRALGVEAAQGFLWTQPLPVEALEPWIEQHRVTVGELASVHALPAGLPGGRPHGPDESLILRMHGEGASLNTIAAALNRAGSRTSAGVRWHVRTVARVIAPPPSVRPEPPRHMASAG